jgi:hypothetical protein
VKTYGRPYDDVVAAVLVIAKHHAPSEMLNLTSDDAWDAWSPALELCRRAGVTISDDSVALLRADVNHESPVYEPPKSDEERALDAEWDRISTQKLLKTFCEERFSPKYLRYQAAYRTTKYGVTLQLRRSIDARSLPAKSPELRQKADELQIAWNDAHPLKILTIEIS